MGSVEEPSSPVSDVAVVIVNYRTKELTVAAARSVLTEPEVAEVVVVDNGSNDGSADHLSDRLTGSSPAVSVVASARNLGFGQGCELGVRHSSAPVLFFVNSDATVAPGSVGVLRRALLDDPRSGVVAPLVFGPDGRTVQVDSYGVFPSLRTLLVRANRRPSASLEPDWVSGVAMMLRRVDHNGVGGFDRDFAMYLEDVDLCRRLRAAGRGVRRVPGAAVTHLGGASRSSSAEQRRQYHLSQRLYFEKAGAGPLTLAGVRFAAVLRRLQAGAGFVDAVIL